MTVARARSLLWLTAALGAAGAAGAWVAAVWPIPAVAPLERAVVVAVGKPSPEASVPPLEEFESAWNLPLRRPLVDPPAPVTAVQQPTAPTNLMVRLIGTIVDGRRPRGVFLVGLAGVEVKGVGETAGGADPADR